MTEPLNLLRQHGFSELACQFAAFIDRKESDQHPVVSLTAGLLTEAMAQGHVCLNLKDLPESVQPLADLLPDNVDDWINQLRAAYSVGQPGEYNPLILTDDGLLYLYRYWLDERDVAQAIHQRLHGVADLDTEQLNQDLADWHNPIAGVDWQKVAVAIALSRHLAVISGGPGTGKTTIVLKILQCLLNQSPDYRIGLAAPTGKAAARLQQSISRQQPLEVKTLHRMLGITERNDQGRYNAERPLPVDVLIIDEASMIDISLMAKLMRALPEKARLILLGDSQQLASVESGAVLANLSESEQGTFSDAFIRQFPKLGLEDHTPDPSSPTPTDPSLHSHTTPSLRTEVKQSSPELDSWADTEKDITTHGEAVLTDSFVRLQHSYRFDKDSLIGQLADKVNAGQADQVIERLQQTGDSSWLPADEHNIQNTLSQGYKAFIEAVESDESPGEILQAFDQFRFLAALKQGPQSVTSVNRMMSRFLARRGWRTSQTFYPGQPIMITRNDYRQQLFNGDIGVILRDADGQLKACFDFGEDLRWVGLNRLPAHETVFAMTVHKSQGSEFNAISILLPDEPSPILNRELLYTAITRARETLNILAVENVLKQTILKRHQRESGLKHQLKDDG